MKSFKTNILISPDKMVADDKPTYRYGEKPVYTTSNGCPVENPSSWQRLGPKPGPLLLQDFHLIDLLAHFDRERIPERVVHAKGAGAYGEFEVTHDISDICSIDMLNGVGKKTPLVTRFSTVGGEKGSADSARDPRGKISFRIHTLSGMLLTSKRLLDQILHPRGQLGLGVQQHPSLLPS